MAGRSRGRRRDVAASDPRARLDREPRPRLRLPRPRRSTSGTSSSSRRATVRRRDRGRGRRRAPARRGAPGAARLRALRAGRGPPLPLREPDPARARARLERGRDRARARRRRRRGRPRAVPGRAARSSACALEGHADNLAAALIGGVCLTLAATAAAARGAHRRPTCRRAPSLVVPVRAHEHRRLARRAARASVPHEDAAATAGAAALLGAAVAAGDAELLAAAFADRLHEPYRSPDAPLLRELRAHPAERRARRHALRLRPVGRRLGAQAPTRPDVARTSQTPSPRRARAAARRRAEKEPARHERRTTARPIPAKRQQRGADGRRRPRARARDAEGRRLHRRGPRASRSSASRRRGSRRCRAT